MYFLTDYWNIDGNGTYTGMGCGAGGPGCNLKVDGSACNQSECDNAPCPGAVLGLTKCPTHITVDYSCKFKAQATPNATNTYRGQQYS